MTELYITIGLTLDEIPTHINGDFLMYNQGDLIKMFPDMIGSLGYSRPNLLNKYLDQELKESKRVVVISGFENRKEYFELSHNSKLQLKTVFIRHSDTIEEYRRKWENLSNWVDTVQYHEEREIAWNQELDNLAEVLKADGVEVEFVD